MRKTSLLTTTLIVGCLAVAVSADAQILGGSGGISGGVMGGLGNGSMIGGSAGAPGRVFTDTGEVTSRATRATDRARIRAERAARRAETKLDRTGATTDRVLDRTDARTNRILDRADARRDRVLDRTGARTDRLLDRTSTRVDQTVRTTVLPTRRVLVAPTRVVGYLGDTHVGVAGRHDVLVASGLTVLPAAAATVYIDRQQAELSEELVGTGVEVVRRGETLVVQMPADVTFAFDKADIQPRFHRVLDAVAGTINRYPATYVDVEGHADAIGSDAYNQALSERRASAVASYLLERRTMPERMYVEGYGESQPVASNSTVEGRARNRRVEIVLRPHTAEG